MPCLGVNKKGSAKIREIWVRGLAAGWACHLLGRVSAVHLAGGPSAPPAFREHDLGQVLEEEIHRMTARDTVRGSVVSPTKYCLTSYPAHLPEHQWAATSPRKLRSREHPAKRLSPRPAQPLLALRKCQARFPMQRVNDVSFKGIKQGVPVL